MKRYILIAVIILTVFGVGIFGYYFFIRQGEPGPSVTVRERPAADEGSTVGGGTAVGGIVAGEPVPREEEPEEASPKVLSPNFPEGYPGYNPDEPEAVTFQSEAELPENLPSEPAPSEAVPSTPVTPVPEPGVADTDGDGLNDIDETNKYGTNPRRFDTDGDGLTDGEEANRWKTDPNKADSDGDGFSDGTEVQGGYNPLGPGRL